MVVTLHLYVVYVSQNKQQISHYSYTTLTDWFYNRIGECLLRGTHFILSFRFERATGNFKYIHKCGEWYKLRNNSLYVLRALQCISNFCLGSLQHLAKRLSFGCEQRSGYNLHRPEFYCLRGIFKKPCGHCTTSSVRRNGFEEVPSRHRGFGSRVP